MRRSCNGLPELLLAAAGVAGLLVARGREAAAALFWADEVATCQAIALPPLELVVHRYAEAHSPLYFLLLRGFVLLAAGPDGPGRADELLLRLPSLVAMGLAGGLLAAAAWRAWGRAAGLLLLALWVTSTMVGSYALEARPYALLVLLVAASLWSATRLWLVRDEAPSRPLVLLAAAAPVLAAATMPVGAVAVLAMEAAGLPFADRSPFGRLWRRRSLWVVALTLAVLALLGPAIAAKAPGYWTESASPLGLESARLVLSAVYLDGRSLPSGPVALLGVAVVAAFAGRGAVTAWRDLPGRLALSLAVAFPLALVGLSTARSLMVSRYFLCAVPGVLLLAAAGAAGGRGRTRGAGVLALAVAVGLGALAGRSEVRWPFTPELQLELIARLEPGPVEGATGQWQPLLTLGHYLPRRTGPRADIRWLDSPLSEASLPPGDGLLWLFDAGGCPSALDLAGSAPVLCRYRLETGDVVVVGRSRDALPPAMRACPAPAP